MGQEGGSLDPQGPVADAMAELWWLMLALGVIVFVAFLVLLALGLRRRADAASATEERHRRLVARWIGAGGVAMPAVVIGVVFGATLLTMREIPRDAPDGTLEIEVTGHQFWYEVRYPGAGLVTANELHLPVGEQVVLRLRSADVIHSFWVPELGGKLDMLPERTNTLVLQADQPGVYRSRCAEFCGLQHAKMALTVVAEPREQFDAWATDQLALAQQAGEADAAGREVFVQNGCASCHAFRGASSPTSDAPDLTTFPDRRMVAATVPLTRENVVTWIRDPERIKAHSGMPPTPVPDDEMQALLTYLGIEP